MFQPAEDVFSDFIMELHQTFSNFQETLEKIHGINFLSTQNICTSLTANLNNKKMWLCHPGCVSVVASDLNQLPNIHKLTAIMSFRAVARSRVCSGHLVEIDQCIQTYSKFRKSTCKSFSPTRSPPVNTPVSFIGWILARDGSSTLSLKHAGNQPKHSSLPEHVVQR